MNKVLRFAHIVLLLVIVSSGYAAIHNGIELWNANKVNYFIEHVADYKQPLAHPKALFAQAYYDVTEGEYQKALDHLTHVIITDDVELKVAAYYNRGNIHLRQALTMLPDERQRLSLVELAKQDYRTALLLSPQMQDARFNLELALRMVPELPDADSQFDKNIISQERSIETIGFRVDLP